MNEKTYRDPFAIHDEHANTVREEAALRPTPDMSGDEIACVIGGYKAPAIPALFNPGTRTVFPVHLSK